MEDMKGGCGVYYDTVRDRDEWKGKIHKQMIPLVWNKGKN